MTKNLWSDTEAAEFGADPLGQRVYTSRLLGRDPSLVLHGGGNTSVKAEAVDLLGEPAELLYVKGSGWDLATIDRAGFSPVRLDLLRRLAELESIPDPLLVKVQRGGMTDPSAPDPSLEAVLHAVIPYTFVDHTHADAVIALTNTADARSVLREVYGDDVLIVPYVMPGFPLARAVFEMTRGIDWSYYRGMILMNHGVFSWGQDARASYGAMIDIVSEAEAYLEKRDALRSVRCAEPRAFDADELTRIRRAVSNAAARAMIALAIRTPAACGFASREDVAALASQGPLTPDHVIRTRRVPLLLTGDAAADVENYAVASRAYFERHASDGLRMLDPAPRWAIWPGQGLIAFGATPRDAAIVADICEHTIAAIQWADAIGGWRALPERELFQVEYWDLEQAKLAKAGAGRPFDGRVALVTGAASGIGRAVAAELASLGAAVLAVDVRPMESPAEGSHGFAHLVCDLTDPAAAGDAAAEAVRRFGGLDILVCNAGIFPGTERIDELADETWARALDVNLTSHQRLLRACVPHLRHGIAPAVVVVASKNVPAPGPGAAAYSVSKAGLTQLARVAALELSADGIRVNVIHPNAVFDTGMWSEEVLRQRAAAYGLSVEEYRRGNLLRVEVTARQVARAVAAFAGETFACTTGAQIPVDGGNERVI